MNSHSVILIILVVRKNVFRFLCYKYLKNNLTIDSNNLDKASSSDFRIDMQRECIVCMVRELDLVWPYLDMLGVGPQIANGN